jgi:hypothetical protein
MGRTRTIRLGLVMRGSRFDSRPGSFLHLQRPGEGRDFSFGQWAQIGLSPSQIGPRRAGRKATARTRRRDDFAATFAANGPSELSHVRRANAAEVRAGPGVAEVVTTAVGERALRGPAPWMSSRHHSLLRYSTCRSTGLTPANCQQTVSTSTADRGRRGGRDGHDGYCDLRVCTLRTPRTALSR